MVLEGIDGELPRAIEGQGGQQRRPTSRDIVSSLPPLTKGSPARARGCTPRATVGKARGWEDGRQPADERRFGERPSSTKELGGTLGDGEPPARGGFLRVHHHRQEYPCRPANPKPGPNALQRGEIPVVQRSSPGPVRTPKGEPAGERKPLKGVWLSGNRASTRPSRRSNPT